MRSVVRGVGGAGVLLAISLTAARARAQVQGGGGFGFQVRMDLLAQHLRSHPAAAFKGVSQRTEPAIPVTMLGFEAGGDLVLRDRIVIPLVTSGAAFAVGRYPTVYGASEGSVVELRPWGTGQFTVLIGGIGARWKHRRWAWSVMVQPGLSATYLPGKRPGEEDPEQMLGLDLLVRATAAGCRRLDPDTRLCLFVGPNAYLDGWFNGGVMGLRWEYGP